MNLLLHILAVVTAVIVLVALLASSSLYIMVQRTLPQTSGNLAVAGLKDKVEVIRDAWGVPHIYAQNRDDLFFAQGYVMAQDRLWQMEFNRLVAAGRISEFGGKATLKEDILLRSLGLYRTAQATVQRLSPQSLLALEAFARGVDAFVDTHRDRLPLEFTLLNTVGGADVQWEPWTPTDTVAIGNVMALGLCMNMQIEIFRSQMWAKLGPERAADLEPGYPHDGPFIVTYSGKGMSANDPVASAGDDAAGALVGQLADLAQTYDRVLSMALSGRLGCVCKPGLADVNSLPWAEAT